MGATTEIPREPIRISPLSFFTQQLLLGADIVIPARVVAGEPGPLAVNIHYTVIGIVRRRLIIPHTVSKPPQSYDTLEYVPAPPR